MVKKKDNTTTTKKQTYAQTTLTNLAKHQLIKQPFLEKYWSTTKQKGWRGKAKNTKRLVNQKRQLHNYWVYSWTSLRFFQKKPLLLVTTKVNWLYKTKLFFFKSSLGLAFILKNINICPFAFYNFNTRLILPTFQSVVFSQILYFIKPNTKLTKLRDIFNPNRLFSVSFGSVSIFLYFDRWSGFITVRLPSGFLRLFFFLSKTEPFSFNFFRFEKKKLFKTNWKVNWKKAGTTTIKGFKPRVRGVAKNPVDHPHGGRTKSIRFPRTPWGLATKLKN